MKKESHTPNGALFSPELKEITRRLRDKEPELDEIMKPLRDEQEGESDQPEKGRKDGAKGKARRN